MITHIDTALGRVHIRQERGVWSWRLDRLTFGTGYLTLEDACDSAIAFCGQQDDYRFATPDEEEPEEG